MRAAGDVSSPAARATPAGWRWLWLLGWLLLLARLAYVLGHQPLAGFGNQFDMLRTTACVGLQPEGVPAGQASMPAPLPAYRRDGAMDGNCLPGTEVAIVHLALALDTAIDTLAGGDPQRFPLRLLALVKALLLLAALAGLDWRLRAWPAARALHAVLAALLLGDPLNTLYLAGFYTEFASLLPAWIALAWPMPWLLGGRAPSRLGLCAWGGALAALLLARFQHVATPCVLLAWLAWLAWRRGWPLPRFALPLLLLLPALAATLHWQSGYRAIAEANRWNSFFGAALPAARDPATFVGRLALPPACAELVHTSWYLRRGRDARAECAAGMDLARPRWLLGLASEPDSLLRWVARGVLLSGQWRPSYLGELAGREYARLPGGPLLLGSSFAGLVSQLPWTALVALWLQPLALLALLWPSRARGGAVGLVEWLPPALLVLTALGWAASLAGDGYSELARHLHLAGNAALASALLLPWALWRIARVGARPLLLPAAVLLACVLAWAWAWREAIAFGVLDQPAGEVAAGDQAVDGWAIDPRGVREVQVVHADGRRQALAIVDASAELSGIFGAGVGRHAVRFEGRIDARAPVAIEVVPQHGVATVVDRRYFR